MADESLKGGAEVRRGSRAGRRELFGRGAELLALWSFAVAQPLYDLLARTPEFFAARGITLLEAGLFALCLSLLFPLLVLALYLPLTAVAPRVSGALHFLAVAGLTSAFVLMAIKGLPLAGVVLAILAGAAGVACTFALFRVASLRRFVRVLAVSALIFPALFFVRVPTATWNLGAEARVLDTPAPHRPAPIVFLVFDELPISSLLTAEGGIDRQAYPSFAALAERSTWYRSATTTSDFTTTAIPALLTGRYPRPDAQPTTADHPENLFTVLGAHYRVDASESLTRLCPTSVCGDRGGPLLSDLRSMMSDLGFVYLHVVLPGDLATPLPPVDQTWQEFGADERLEEAPPDDAYWQEVFRENAHGDRAADFMRFLSQIEEDESSALYFYASFLPHVPFTYLPSGMLYSVEGGRQGLRVGEDWGADEWAILQSYQRHLLQSGFVDRQLGLLLEHLRDVDLYDSALLIVTADHGVSFRAGDSSRRVTPTNYAEIIGVPLFVKYPGQSEGRVETGVVESVDVLPTILDVLEMPLELEVDGASLLDPQKDERAGHFVVPKNTSETMRFSAEEYERDLREAVRRRVDLFGAEGFGQRFFQIGEYGHLVGQYARDLDVSGVSDVDVEYFLPIQEASYDPGKGFVPAHITGHSSPVEPGRLRNFAVAVNGTIQAITRTWSGPGDVRAGDWSAVVGEEAFQPGENEIEVFLVEPGPDGVRILRTEESELSAAEGTAPLGVVPTFGVEESGFHLRETWANGTPIRWTKGSAMLGIPRKYGGSSEAVRIDLAWTGPLGTNLEVAIDDEVVFSGEVAPGAWSRTFPILAGDGDDSIDIEIRSDTFVPSEVNPDSKDTRELGVAIGGVWLLDSASFAR